MKLTKQEKEILLIAAKRIDRGYNKYSCCAIWEAQMKLTNYVFSDRYLTFLSLPLNTGVSLFGANTSPQSQQHRVLALLMFREVGEDYND